MGFLCVEIRKVHLLVINYWFSMISLEETINEAYNYIEYHIVLLSEE